MGKQLNKKSEKQKSKEHWCTSTRAKERKEEDKFFSFLVFIFGHLAVEVPKTLKGILSSIID